MTQTASFGVTLVVTGGPGEHAGPLHLIKVDTGDGAMRSDEDSSWTVGTAAGGLPVLLDRRPGVRHPGALERGGRDVLAYGG